MATKIKCSADKIYECVASDKVCNVDTGRCKDPKDALKSTVDDKTLTIDFEKGVVGKASAVKLIQGVLGNISKENQKKLKTKAGVAVAKASKGAAIPKAPVQADGDSPDDFTFRDFLKPEKIVATKEAVVSKPVAVVTQVVEVSKPVAVVTPVVEVSKPVVVSKPAFDIKTKTVPEIKKLLKDLGVENYSGKNKDTLIKMYNDAVVKKNIPTPAVSKPEVVAIVAKPTPVVVSKPAFDISTKFVPEIKKILKDLGVVNYSGKNKDALIKMYNDVVATKNIPKEDIVEAVKKVETVDLEADRFKGINKDDLREKLNAEYGVYTTTKDSKDVIIQKFLAAEAKLAESIKKVAEGCDCDPDSCNIETGECESVDELKSDLHVLTVDNKKFHGTEAALRVLAKEMSYAGYRIEKVSGESVEVVESEEAEVKKIIRKRIIEEIEALLTTGRRDEHLEPYSENEIKRYLDDHNEIIDNAVNDMYKEFEDYWKEDGGVVDKVQYVANEPGDAFREFLFAKDDAGNPPRIDETEVLELKEVDDIQQVEVNEPRRQDISLRSLGASPDESPVPAPPSEKMAVVEVVPEFTVSELDEKSPLPLKVSPLQVEKKTVPLIHPDQNIAAKKAEREELIQKVRDYKKEIPNLKALADTISGEQKFSKEEYDLINKIRQCVGV